MRSLLQRPRMIWPGNLRKNTRINRAYFFYALTRTMTRIVEIAGQTGERARNRMRSVGRRVLEIARTSRSKAEKQSQERLAGRLQTLGRWEPGQAS